ncbi:MAG: formate--tetrahydrofolate ligase, partial [Thermoplasmata archaeon]|nr:formate--tetrahydrofolate ligase [Thermoplasmata archaeon]
GQIGAVGAMALLLKDALQPNLVQTIEGGPALIHGGPFANIAHGTSSYLSTKMGLHLSDYFVTEAGFGSDLGAEKFFDIFCRETGLSPSAVVMVVTTRSLKMQGGVPKEKLKVEDLEALEVGGQNLKRHLEIVKLYGVPVVAAINRFETDTEAELAKVMEICRELSVPAAVSDHHANGGEGALEVAALVKRAIEDMPCCFNFLYPDDATMEEAIEAVCTKVYGACKVEYSIPALKKMEKCRRIGMDRLPVCMAKTPYSFSDNAKLLGAPTDFKITISDIRLSAGAGFVVPITGTIMTMPGLPREPAAMKMDVVDGKAVGLF